MPLPSILKANLVRLRGRLGLTQEKLAERASLSHGYISQLEAGMVGFSYKTVTKIAKALDCDESELFRDPDSVLKPSIKQSLEVITEALQADWAAELEQPVPDKKRVSGAAAGSPNANLHQLIRLLFTLNERQVSDLLRYLELDQKIHRELKVDRNTRSPLLSAD
jgi:transcriptional regulator with XRE-family HTH domain